MLEVRPNHTVKLSECPACGSMVESVAHGQLKVFDGDEFLCDRCAWAFAPELVAGAYAQDASETECLLIAAISEAVDFAKTLDEQGRDDEAAAVRAGIAVRQARLRWISEQRLTDPAAWRARPPTDKQ